MVTPLQRLALSFAAAVLSFTGLSFAQTATSPAQHKALSDTELSQRLLGQWESKFETKQTTPVKQVFVSLDSGKTFKLIRIADFGGKLGRLEYEGKWRISSGELILEPTRARALEGSEPLTGGLEKDRIVSAGNHVVLVHAFNGTKRELVRTAVPSELPPLLPRRFLLPAVTTSGPKASAYFAPRPDYRPLPTGQWPQGSGIFLVSIDSKTGVVTAVSVKKSTGWATLNNAAMAALRRWKFKTPSPLNAEVPMTFVAHASQR
jgi:TonB family protein